MNVQIEVPPFLRHLTGDMTVVSVNGTTVGECVGHFVERFPQTEKLLFDENGKLLGQIDIYVNGVSSFPEELARIVKNGDQIYILQLISGG